MRQYRGSAGDVRLAERREKLIEAAIAVYGEVGQAQASVRKICQAAGLTSRYFYESFDNNDELLAAAFQHIVAHLDQAIDAAPLITNAAGAGIIAAKLTAYFEALRSYPSASRVFLIEIPGVSGPVDALYARAMDHFAAKLQVSLHPDTPDSQVTLLARGVQGGILHIARFWISNGYEPPLETVVRTAVELAQPLWRPASGGHQSSTREPPTV